MTELEEKALALLASIDRSLAALARQLPARTGAPTAPIRRGSMLDGHDLIDDRPDHRTLQRGEPARRGAPHRWPR
jgi:hypothetical protein